MKSSNITFRGRCVQRILTVAARFVGHYIVIASREGLKREPISPRSYYLHCHHLYHNRHHHHHDRHIFIYHLKKGLKEEDVYSISLPLRIETVISKEKGKLRKGEKLKKTIDR